MEIKNKTFERYLHGYNYAQRTVSEYVRLVNAFLNSNPSGHKYTHKEIVSYMNDRANDYPDTDTALHILHALKKYYSFLIETGQREDHPCFTLNMKAKKGRTIIHQDLFTSEELEQLVNRKEFFDVFAVKHQLTISLLIYQGLMAGELLRLKVQDINFDNGTMFIRSSRNQNSRYLGIHPKQVQLLDQYITGVRKRLLRTQTDLLLISSRTGMPIKIDDMSHVMKSCKPMFPDRNLHPITIRKSVIANWLNERKLPLEQVQIMAGHKCMSSTERYKQSNPIEQRELMNKWFPI
jgi:integrase/recombinase XerD